MAIVTLPQIKAQLGITADIGSADDALLTDKIAAAQAHIERGLGFKIADRFGGEDQDPVPPDLAEAVLQLVAWWYDDHSGEKEPPFGVADIIMSHKDWSF